MVALGSLVVINADSVPIPLSFSGGIAIVANFLECPANCEYCPWDSNVSSRDAKVLIWSSKIVEVLINTKPDVLVLMGAEPYLSSSSIALAYEAHRIGITVALKILGRYLMHALELEIMNLVDLLLLEVRDERDLVRHFDTDKHVEVIIVSDALDQAIKLLDSLSLPQQSPIAIVTRDEDVNAFKALKLVDRMRTKYPLLSIPFSHSTELSSIYCPACGLPLIVRVSGVPLKPPRIVSGRCPVCGYPIHGFRSKRFVRVPISEPLM